MVRVSKKLQRKKDLALTEGSLVEVCTKEKGLTAVWFDAIVIDPNPSPSSHSRSASKRGFRVLIEYKALLSDDGHSPLQELVNLECIRPCPPALTSEGFELHDAVDAFYKDGWWTGVVTKILDSSRYVVTFRKPPDELEFGLSELRPHQKWINGNWIRPNRKDTPGLVFSVGKEVEVAFEGEDCKDAWFPSKLVKDCSNGYFMVNCLKPNTEIEEQIRAAVCSSHIRPCPPPIKNIKSFDLHDKVDSFFDSGWWFGVIKEVLPDSRYAVAFLNEKKSEKVVNHSDLRPHMVWKDGKWHSHQGESLSLYSTLEDANNCNGLDVTQNAATYDSQDATTNETSGEKISRSLDSEQEMSEELATWKPSSASVSLKKKKRRLDPAKEGFSIQSLSLTKCKKSANGSKTPTEKIPSSFSSPDQSSLGKAALKTPEKGSISSSHRKRGRPQKQKVNHSLSITQGKLNRKRGRPSKQSGSTPDATKESLTSENGGEKVEGPKVSEDDQPLAAWVVKVNSPTGIDGSTLALPPPPPEGEVTMPNNLPPFVKKDTFLWDRIESRDAFQKIPQTPHFRPLQHFEDFRRETLAIFYMGTFADLVDKACSMSLDEPRNTVERMLDALAELEPHGFNVEPIRGRVKEMLMCKDKQEHLKDLSAGAHSEMEKHCAAMADLSKQKAEMEKRLAEVVAKMGLSENEIASLQSSMDAINEELGHLCRDYEALISKPFDSPV